jgi:competence protein ComEC
MQVLALERGGTTLLVDDDGQGLVVDTGGDPNATRLRAALSTTGVTDYDLWLTGGDPEALGGAGALLRTSPPSDIGFNGITQNNSAYRRYLRGAVASDRQRNLFEEENGFTYIHSSGTVSVLAPPSDFLANGTPAHNRLVLTYTTGSTRVLWTGNLSRRQADWLTDTHDDALDATVLVVPANATLTPRLLDAIAPETVVIQGTGDPVDNTTAAVYQTARDGTVTVDIAASGVTVAAANGTAGETAAS